VNESEQFLRRLKSAPRNSAVFNPWWESDTATDIGPAAPKIRRRQLDAYLTGRLGRAKIALVGEALGYQGGHFSGIAMTSERLLLGHKADAGIDPSEMLPGLKPRRTSKPDLIRNGFSEPTATIVWGTLLALGVGAREFVLWNAFPWHPFNERLGLLSNRKPTGEELGGCAHVLAAFLAMFEFQAVVALGVIAAQQLDRVGCRATAVRHPASGGARDFREQIAEVLKKRESARLSRVRDEALRRPKGRAHPQHAAN
jgi:Uracil DNA glycosylase superfamily